MLDADQSLLNAAHEARVKFRTGSISYQEAVIAIKPFITRVNEYGRKLAADSGVTHKNVSVTGFLR